MAANDEIEREFARQDKEWTGPKFFGLGIVTLLIAVTIIVYAATAIGGTLCTDEECLESAEFAPAAIPWDELAFRSTHEALSDYLKGIRHPVSIAVDR